MPRFCVIALVIILAATRARADEIVTFTSPTNRQARARVKGQVLDYTGQQITIKLAEGRELKRPSSQVIEIESDWPPEQLEADRSFAQHQFQTAREQYTAAIRKEDRRWVRRRMFARLIACHRELGQFDAAGKLFLALAHDDPETPYFDQIPLAWLPGEPAAGLAQTATAWLDDENPLAALLGASHLLATARRAAALKRLAALEMEKDRRIACLAEAQSWRANIATADDVRLARWRRRAEEFPEALRAGPYSVLGHALAQHGSFEGAALTLLHMPILFPDARDLSADSLAASAELLEKLSDADGAARLRCELIATYPETRAAKLAKLPAGDEPREAAVIPKLDADSPEQAFLAGLRSRRLYSLAAVECRTRLADSGLGGSQRVMLMIAQSRTHVEQALEQAPSDRGPFWRQALDAVLPAAKIEGSRRLLLDAQTGLVHLAQGELTRQEAEIAGSPAPQVEAARVELRAAVSALDHVAEDAAEALRRANQEKQTDPRDLDASELIALRRNVAFQLARAYRNQGQSYPPQSPDRVNSLRQAAEKFAELSGGDTPDEVTWRCRLDEIACLRLLEDFRAAAGRLSQLPSLDPPPTIAAGARAEQIRLALAVGRLPDALRAVDAARQAAEPSADLDYACLEAYASAWRAAAEAHDQQKSSQWQDRAAALARQIDDRYGPYWSRRADLLVAGGVGSGGGENLTLLVRAAESFYRNGQIDQALTTYDRAAELASKTKQPDLAFDAAYTAAAIEQERGRHAGAAERFRHVALSAPEHPKASEAHLLAIYNAAQTDEGATPHDPSAPALDYATLLGEHLQRWPSAASANQARVWLGRLNEQAKKWGDAIAAYRGVTPDDPRATEAVEAIARCYNHILADSAAAGRPTLGVATDAARYFEGLVTSPRGNLPERWSQTERVAALNAASLWLQYTDEFERAERLLSAALAQADEAPAAWRSSAQALDVFAVAAQGRRDEAAKRLAGLADGAPEQLLLVVEGLSRVAAKATPAVRRELAELQLQAATLVRSKAKTLSPSQRRALDLAVVRGLAAAGRLDEAAESARQLAAASPRDGDAQEEYARLLVDAANWPEALTAWRVIQKKCREGSDRWLRSSYYQAASLHGLGKSDEAARLIRLTEALHPELGGPELKTRFRELLKQTR